MHDGLAASQGPTRSDSTRRGIQRHCSDATDRAVSTAAGDQSSGQARRHSSERSFAGGGQSHFTRRAPGVKVIGTVLHPPMAYQ